MKLEKMIKTGSDLREWYFDVVLKKDKESILTRGLFVDAGIRREILTGENQGRIILQGKIREIQFENLGGGVYRTFLSIQ